MHRLVSYLNSRSIQATAESLEEIQTETPEENRTPQAGGSPREQQEHPAGQLLPRKVCREEDRPAQVNAWLQATAHCSCLTAQSPVEAGHKEAGKHTQAPRRQLGGVARGMGCLTLLYRGLSSREPDAGLIVSGLRKNGSASPAVQLKCQSATH